MKKLFLQSGKIVGTHGVKGMLRVQPWCDSNEVLCSFKRLYLNNGEVEFKVETAKPHGNISLIKLNGINTIEEAEKLRGKILYINREDYKLPKGAYFIEDLIDMPVYDNCGKKLGVLCDVTNSGASDIWHIKDNENLYLVPKIDEINANVDFDNNKIEITPLKGIFNDEDWYFNPFSRCLR